ncbi:MAG: YicC/YloC family endoribonuclease [Angelakisella sp.]
MIRSMTGYGRAQQVVNGRDITVELRSVNHRYFEYSSRLPRSANYMDDRLKKLVQSAVSRGKVEVGLTLATDSGSQVEVNVPLAQEYLTALRAFGQAAGVPDDLTLSALSRLPDIFTVTKAPEDEEQLWNDVAAVARQAIDCFLDMRRVEGDKLKEDLLGRLTAIEDAVTLVEQRSPQTVTDYRARLTAKLQEVLGSTTLDEQRMITEVAILSEKLAVDEETVRLRSHISQLRDILNQPDAVGRKLDFLVQEMNREINTIGSKSQDVAIARIVVEVKSEIEKIREQVQNIE